MLKKIKIVENTLDPESWKEFETENVLDFIVDYFESWPETARLYHNSVSEISDITPNEFTNFEEIQNMDGEFIVVVYPAGAATWIVVSLVVSLVSIAYTLLNQPKIPTVATRTGDLPSSNNELSERSNKARLGGRVPDIYGQVRSVPDLISLPYKIFFNNYEVEHSLMCIGRGEFDVSDVRDGDTPLNEIDGCSVGIYGPGTSPNYGSPQMMIGPAIDIPVQSVYRSNSVNGQVVQPSMEKLQFGPFFKIAYPNELRYLASDKDMTEYFSAGGTVALTDCNITISSLVYNMDGIYTIASVTSSSIFLTNPASVNTSWNAVTYGYLSEFIDPFVQSNYIRSLGPFYLDKTINDEVWLNFVAQNGLYKDNGTGREKLTVDLQIFVEQVDSNNNPTGLNQTFTDTIGWYDTTKLNVGLTVKCNPTFNGPMRVTVKRLTNKIYENGYQINDEVKWSDLYAIDAVNINDFGDVTIVQSLTRATSGALSLKERKLNMLVTRKIPLHVSGETFSATKQATTNIKDIIPHIALDSRIGNMPIESVDLDQIHSTADAIDSYFGNALCSKFCYTFDSDNLSFEEIVSTVANAVFCTAYRRGSKLKLSFEKKMDIPTILFNHRNKVPGTEERTVTFGNVSDNDGIEFSYVDPEDDAIVTLYMPENRSALNPKKVESVGIRNATQAKIHTDRLYNKLKFQNQTVEFEATAEANVAIKNDKILVSDGTRSGIFDGEVIAQNALELTLSQDINLLDGVDYTMFLQLYDGTVESIGITKTSVKNKVILDRAPLLNLIYDSAFYARTTFLITSNDDYRQSAFILTEKSPQGTMTCNLKAINYDDRYYQNDLDFVEN